MKYILELNSSPHCNVSTERHFFKGLIALRVGPRLSINGYLLRLPRTANVSIPRFFLIQCLVDLRQALFHLFED